MLVVWGGEWTRKLVDVCCVVVCGVACRCGAAGLERMKQMTGRVRCCGDGGSHRILSFTTYRDRRPPDSLGILIAKPSASLCPLDRGEYGV